MKKLLFTFVLSTIIIFACSQNISEIKCDTLNKYNENGKKHGYWVELLNENFKPIKKVKNATYFWYVLYLNGQRMVIKTYPPSFYAGFLYPASFMYAGNSGEKGIILLDGKMSVYRKNIIYYYGSFHLSMVNSLIIKNIMKTNKYH